MSCIIYPFGDGRSAGGASMKSILGEKGANACEMVSMGLPVPPGFVISAEGCLSWAAAASPQLEAKPPAAVVEALAQVEQRMGQRFGASDKPLLLSVRSTAAASMPGLMGTVLNLGMSDAIVNAQVMKNERHFMCDLYRRFITNYAGTVKQLDTEPFEQALSLAKRQLDAKCMLGRKHEDGDLPLEDLEDLVVKYKAIYEAETGEAFPQDPLQQLSEVIGAAFTSWENPRAARYRQRNGITGLLGVAVVVEAMVFGNYEQYSGTGSAFLRNPNTGEPELVGEWLENAQGLDYLVGERAVRQLTTKTSREWAQSHGIAELTRTLEYPSLEETMPHAYQELKRIQEILLTNFEDMEFMEFTVQTGCVWLLQTHMCSRAARKHTADAAASLLTPKHAIPPKPFGPDAKAYPSPPRKAKTSTVLTSVGVVQRWVDEIAELVAPNDLHLCDGSRAEFDKLAEIMVAKGTFKRLNPKKRPDSFLCCSDPGDVARVEECTFICCEKEEDAGPTNNWYDPKAMKAELRGLFKGSMRGRTMYVIPYCMGPIGSPFSKVGVQVTDSPYAVLNMHIMARVGEAVLRRIDAAAQAGEECPFVPGVHSVGYPLILPDGGKREDKLWPCNLENRYITHFPETREIWSFGSGYGGNALLGKKCFALRIASAMGRDQGWMAEHMLILKLTSPQGEVRHVTAAFPSACGKTNLAMLQPTLPGWKVECVGDDIAWMHFGDDGRLYAINPEAGFFGVAPGTNDESNYNAMRSFDQRAIFTNVALTDDGDVWWEGMTKEPPTHLTDWKGNSWTPQSGVPAAHANSRFTCPAGQCPTIAPEFDAPGGVPIDAILFGGRRDNTQPLVVESLSWEHGTFLGAIMASKKTAAAAGKVGELRFDPMAILPFCGYNMADYWQHWLTLGAKGGNKMPRIFYVNWFRKGSDGKIMWPGFGENIRVLKWISERCAGRVQARETPIGHLPLMEDVDCGGLGLTDGQLAEIFSVKREEWEAFVPEVKKHLDKFGSRLPQAIRRQFELLKDGVSKMPDAQQQAPQQAPTCAFCKGMGFVSINLDDESDASMSFGAGPYPGTMECPRCA